MRLFYDSPQVVLFHGRAAEYQGPTPDLILTNPYGPMPARFAQAGVPMLLHQWEHRRPELLAWSGLHEVDLQLLSLWNRNREAVWAVHLAPLEVHLEDLVPTEEGWWPQALPDRLLAQYAVPGLTLWDGFCGRGSGGKAALAAGMRYVGIDERLVALEAAKAYLGLP